MNKVGLVLAGAVMFDLGVVVPSSHAAYDAFLKLDSAQPHGELKLKLDKVNNAAVCQAHGGSVIKIDTVEYCKVPANHPTHGGQ
jgi:hypothetical protein